MQAERFIRHKKIYPLPFFFVVLSLAIYFLDMNVFLSLLIAFLTIFIVRLMISQKLYSSLNVKLKSKMVKFNFAVDYLTGVGVLVSTFGFVLAMLKADKFNNYILITAGGILAIAVIYLVFALTIYLRYPKIPSIKTISGLHTSLPHL
jgi:hypothetical protein